MYLSKDRYGRFLIFKPMLLKKGMESPDVANLQRAILSLGFKGLEADGVYGVKTENVVKYIQKSNGLSVDGIAGDNTLAVLDRLYEPSVKNFSSSNYVPSKERKNVPTKGYSQGKLSGVHPKLAGKARQMIELAKAEGYTIKITQGLRTFAQQDRLFRKRPRVTRARGGQSSHNYGVAVDFAFIVNGKLSWNTRLYKNIGRWANQVGLTWGGNWKFVDMPHCQLANIPNYRQMLSVYNAAGKGELGIQAVWKKFVG